MLFVLGLGAGLGLGLGDELGAGDELGFGFAVDLGRGAVTFLGLASSSAVPVEGGDASDVGEAAAVAAGRGAGTGTTAAAAGGAGGGTTGPCSSPPETMNAPATIAAKRKPPMMSPFLLLFCCIGGIDAPIGDPSGAPKGEPPSGAAAIGLTPPGGLGAKPGAFMASAEAVSARRSIKPESSFPALGGMDAEGAELPGREGEAPEVSALKEKSTDDSFRAPVSAVGAGAPYPPTFPLPKGSASPPAAATLPKRSAPPPALTGAAAAEAALWFDSHGFSCGAVEALSADVSSAGAVGAS